MSKARIQEIIRRFPENGIKLLLENPKNAEDLLRLTGAKIIGLIDCAQLTRIQNTFVQRDYRHLESDVVLLAPLRQKKAPPSRKQIVIYILIEHQSEPDGLMPLRLLEYVVQIFKSQTRAWSRRHRSFAGIRLQPVLPVVFYTGTRRWDKVGRLVDLVEMGQEFREVTPILDPLFINLHALQSGKLESEGGFFGWVLRLVQERQSRPSEFDELLKRVIQHLETMPGEERLRWLELLSYIQALVYHDRNRSEHAVLETTIEASVQRDQQRQEVTNMGDTIADMFMEKGHRKGKKEGQLEARRQILLRQLHKRFREVPPEIRETVESTKDVKQLDLWLDRVLSAQSLDQLRISPQHE
jgi:hypothetical protein